uniref:Probable 2-oxoglutarate-dependent dioxygenase At3g111800 n=1 Tax=Elaeis guineensis var. tenera TaxID=51953 RepID=A0A8N4EZ55_ELAGV|nr:probable 2-oxoglutarate-dependent dioxygenase At3g111800 [Elaeis guineensis]
MDCLQEWPEPVVPVQSLSESGAPAIPDRYIKPPSDRPSFDSATDENILGIPVIDLGRLSEGALECRATMEAISDACREWGFFQVVNHGISHEVMEKIQEVWRGFFHLPMEAKKAYANSPTTYEGYGSRVGVQKDAILDWGDYYFLQYLPPSVKNHNKWPGLPTPIRYVLSNAMYKSVEHRVVVNAAEERLSLAFFYNPKSDLPLGPAPQLVTSNRPPLYQSMTYNEYRLYIRKNGPRGKTQVESLKDM